MRPAFSKSPIDILLASGAPSGEEAVALAANLNCNSCTADVLNSGKVDEIDEGDVPVYDGKQLPPPDLPATK